MGACAAYHLATYRVNNIVLLEKEQFFFMHGPVAGKLMSEYIVHREFMTLDVSMLDLARFQEGRWIKEYNVV